MTSTGQTALLTLWESWPLMSDRERKHLETDTLHSRIHLPKKQTTSAFSILYPLLDTFLHIIFENLWHLCQTWLAKTQKLDNIFSWWGCGKTGIFLMKNVTTSLKRNLAVSAKAIYAFIHWPSNIKIYMHNIIYCNMIYNWKILKT